MKELICIVCPKGCHLSVDPENGFAVTGNHCPRGAEYGANELQHPMRTLTTTVAISGGAHDRLPVRTSCAIPKEKMADCMKLIHTLHVESPVAAHTVLVPNLLGTGADLIATRSL